MGIGMNLISKFEIIDKECEGLETPFGELNVYINNEKTNFILAKRNLDIRGNKELNADVYNIRIDTCKLKVNDIIDFKINGYTNFDYYSSDECTYMITTKNSKYTLAITGYDTNYDYRMPIDNYEYSYAIYGNEKDGFKYIIVDSPKKHLDYSFGTEINIWITWLRANPKYDLEAEIDLELT